MELHYLADSPGFSIAKNHVPPRLYFFMKSFDQPEVARLRQSLFELADDLEQCVLVFDYFDFNLIETDVSLQEARDALVELGVRNVYRVGPFERLCKLINSLDYESRYNAYFCLSYGELNNLLRMLHK